MVRLTLIATSAVLALSSISASAQATGDGFQGPRLFGDSQLDQSLAAMNRTLQLTYARNDAIEDLVQPAEPTLAELAVALLDRPEPAEDAPLPLLADDAAAQFAPVEGDASLDVSMAKIASLQDDRGSALFLRVAHASSGDLGTQIDDGIATISEFGPEIAGDATLTIKMVHINDLIAPGALDVEPISLPVRAFDDASLDAWGAVLRTPPTDL